MNKAQRNDLYRYLVSDFCRIYGTKSDSFNLKFLLKIIKRCRKTWLFWFRCAKYKSWWQPLAKHMYRKMSTRYLIDIPLTTKIGYGLYIGHPRCIVINGGTVIGNNVNMSQFLSIGTNHDTPAVIGDNVYIGPLVSIVENVHIGNNVTIGASSVVTKDIPDNATAAGNPAHILNFNMPGRYINNKFEA